MQLELGKIYEGKVTGIKDYGAFVEIIGENVTGMVHISQISNEYVSNANEHLTEGQIVNVKFIGTNDDGKIKLSIKETLPQEPRNNNFQPRRNNFNNNNNGNNRGFNSNNNNNGNNRGFNSNNNNNGNNRGFNSNNSNNGNNRGFNSNNSNNGNNRGFNSNNNNNGNNRGFNSNNNNNGNNRGFNSNNNQRRNNNFNDFSKKSDGDSFEDMLSKFKQHSEENLNDIKKITDRRNRTRRK